MMYQFKLNHKYSQKGIALIQVLLITAILTVLAMYLTSVARDQVTISQLASDRSSALVNITDVESELLFTLLTNTKVNDADNIGLIDDELVPIWNFHNTPFIFQTVDIRIQDHAGLMHAKFPNNKLLLKLLTSNGVSTSNAHQIVDGLLDWQDLDSIPRANGVEKSSLDFVNSLGVRDGAIPYLDDIRHVSNLPENIVFLLKNNMSLYRKSMFNPTTSPFDVLKALTNESTAREVVILRDNKTLSNSEFSQITGLIENDHMLFYPSHVLTLNLKNRVGDSVAEKLLVIELNPYATSGASPINLYQTRG